MAVTDADIGVVHNRHHLGIAALGVLGALETARMTVFASIERPAAGGDHVWTGTAHPGRRRGAAVTAGAAQARAGQRIHRPAGIFQIVSVVIGVGMAGAGAVPVGGAVSHGAVQFDLVVAVVARPPGRIIGTVRRHMAGITLVAGIGVARMVADHFGLAVAVPVAVVGDAAITDGVVRAELPIVGQAAMTVGANRIAAVIGGQTPLARPGPDLPGPIVTAGPANRARRAGTGLLLPGGR
ncbi:MAG: hypothetical protein JRE16_03225, partial [Deltaproteobacteria bacterium]|nr:hypothetical protein [Deltaproteobacteria bacterium]